MKMIWNAFKIAFSMYSKIPMPKTDWNKKNMKYALCFFPAVGISHLVFNWKATFPDFSNMFPIVVTIWLSIIIPLIFGGLTQRQW